MPTDGRSRDGHHPPSVELAGLLHDLRAPAVALRHLGEDIEAGSPDATALGTDVRQEAERLLRMLATAGREDAARRRRATDLVALAEGALARARRLARHDGGHRLDALLPDEPLVAEVDADEVLRALSNLLGNASNYSPPGSTIHLELRREAREALIVVSDVGMGIAPDELERITRPEVRAPAAVAAGIAGTGLGLAVVRRVADAHDGRLDIVSAVGEGSTFTLRLPLRA